MTSKKPLDRSGIYIRVGPRNIDLVTQASAQQFKEWMEGKGISIDFMGEDALNGKRHGEIFSHRLRCAFIQDVEANKGFKAVRVVEEWNRFTKALSKE